MLLGHLIPPAVLLLAIHISPYFSPLPRKVTWIQSKHWQGLPQAVQMPSSQGSPWAIKQVLPTSNCTFPPAMPWSVSALCMMHWKSSQHPQEEWLVIPFWPPPPPPNSQHWILSHRYHKRKTWSLSSPQHSLTLPWGGTAGATADFVGRWSAPLEEKIRLLCSLHGHDTLSYQIEDLALLFTN